jgi:addiction module RelE/StbE family toxin
MVKVDRTGKFERNVEELAVGNGELELLIRQKIKLFEKNPDDTRLENHALKRKMKGKWAFSITDDIRIVYEWTSKQSVRFLAIGGHTKVYGKGEVKDQGKK